MTLPVRDLSTRTLLQVTTPDKVIILNGAYGNPTNGTAAWYGTPTGGSPGWNSGFEYLVAVDYEIDITVHGGDEITVTIDFPNATTKAGGASFPADDDDLFPYTPAYRDSAAVQIDITGFRPAGPAA